MKSRLAIATAVCLFGFDPGSGLKAQGSGDPLSTWHDRTPADARIRVGHVAFAGERFFALGEKRTNFNEVWMSSDGVKWTGHSTGTTNREFSSVAFGNGIFVVLGSYMTGGNLRKPVFDTAISTSTNAVDWLPLPLAGTSLSLSNGTISGLAFGDGKFMMLGCDASRDGFAKLLLWTSTDGRNWKVHRPGILWNASNLSFAGNRFISADPGGRVLSIHDPEEWVRTKNRGAQLWPIGTLAALNSVTYGNNLFVVVGDSWNLEGTTPVIATSPDAKQWNVIEFPEMKRGMLNAVAYGGNAFVTGGYFINTLLVSRDGTNWSPRSVGTNVTVTSVAYGKGTFLLGGSGKIWQSDPMTK